MLLKYIPGYYVEKYLNFDFQKTALTLNLFHPPACVKNHRIHEKKPESLNVSLIVNFTAIINSNSRALISQ